MRSDPHPEGVCNYTDQDVESTHFRLKGVNMNDQNTYTVSQHEIVAGKVMEIYRNREMTEKEFKFLLADMVLNFDLVNRTQNSAEFTRFSGIGKFTKHLTWDVS
jgi:hypothetical protein